MLKNKKIKIPHIDKGPEESNHKKLFMIRLVFRSFL